MASFYSYVLCVKQVLWFYCEWKSKDGSRNLFQMNISVSKDIPCLWSGNSGVAFMRLFSTILSYSQLFVENWKSPILTYPTCIWRFHCGWPC